MMFDRKTTIFRTPMCYVLCIGSAAKKKKGDEITRLGFFSFLIIFETRCPGDPDVRVVWIPKTIRVNFTAPFFFFTVAIRVAE